MQVQHWFTVSLPTAAFGQAAGELVLDKYQGKQRRRVLVCSQEAQVATDIYISGQRNVAGNSRMWVPRASWGELVLDPDEELFGIAVGGVGRVNLEVRVEMLPEGE